MRKVETVGNSVGAKIPKPIQLIYYRGKHGTTVITDQSTILKNAERIVYLGRCKSDGDAFAVYVNGHISFYYGKLNDGVY